MGIWFGAISSSTLSGAERHRNPVYFGAIRIVITKPRRRIAVLMSGGRVL